MVMSIKASRVRAGDSLDPRRSGVFLSPADRDEQLLNLTGAGIVKKVERSNEHVTFVFRNLTGTWTGTVDTDVDIL